MSPPGDEPVEVAFDALERCTCHICLEPVAVEDSEGGQSPSLRDRNGAGVRSPCGVCRGADLGYVHLACLRNDMLVRF